MDEVSNQIDGSVVGAVVQAGHIGQVVLPATPTSALDGLPPVGVGFAGRTEPLATLADALRPGDTGVPVSVLAGLAGVGKTALALRAAHDAVDAGWFPGGALFVNLQGYDDTPVSTTAALGTFLRALGLPDQFVAPDVAGREVQYRSALADLARRGRAVLVLLDNASSAAQVRPLLPGSARHRVLVTSRHTLSDLRSARLVEVDVLGDTEAAMLVDTALRVAHPDDDRALREPDAVRTLVEWCGHLPLALSIVSAVLAGVPERSVARFLDTLRPTTTRLAELAYGDDRVVRRAFQLSYARLAADEARLFRLLSLFPGQYVNAGSAAALANLPETRAGHLLDSLRRAHMVEPGQGDGWFWLHDLVRLFAIERGRAEESTRARRSALSRLFRHYVRRARAVVVAFRSEDVPAGFGSVADAYDWLSVEARNLVSIQGVTALEDLVGGRAPTRSMLAAQRGLTTALVVYSEMPKDRPVTSEDLDPGLRQRMVDLVDSVDLTDYPALREGGGAVLVRALDGIATHDQVDGAVYRRADCLIGILSYVAGDHDTALHRYQEALAEFRSIGNTAGQAFVLTSLAVVQHGIGQFEAAGESLREAVELFLHSGLPEDAEQAGELLAGHDVDGPGRCALCDTAVAGQEDPTGHDETP